MLKNTGERLILEKSWNLMTTLEHLHRYNSVTPIIKDKKVLDAACGTGYGSHILSRYAKSVIGIDLSAEAIAYAKDHYANTNLQYENMSITDIKIPEHSMDAIISFETIEHVTAECQKEFLKEVSRVLKNDGIFVVSTPNDQLLRDISFGSYKNEFHLCELKEDEFIKLLHQYFPYVEVYYQTVTEVSSIVKKGHSDLSGNIYSMVEDNTIGRYYIAICSYHPQNNFKLNSCFLPDPKQYFDETYFTKSARIYLDMGAGYTGQDFVECKYISRNGEDFDVTFSLEEYENQPIKSIRFDPCEHGAEIKINNLKGTGSAVQIKPYNGYRDDSGVDVFMTLDPIYELQIENIKLLKSLSISGQIFEIPTPKILEHQERRMCKYEVEIEEIKQKKICQEIENSSLNGEINSLKDQLLYEREVSQKRQENIEYLTNELKKATEENERLNKLCKQNFLHKVFQQQLTNQKKNLEKSLNEKSVDHEKIVQQKNEELNEIKNSLDYWVERYNAIEKSTSWRMTKPVRALIDYTKKKRNYGKQGSCIPIITEMPRTEKVCSESEIDRNLLWDYDCYEENKEDLPLVSVIVPNYNHAPYLRERLESIYNQTYPNYEVILLDDCSKDNSREILDAYAEAYWDRTKKAYNVKNCGKVFKQWDKGISLAKGELIWIAESDDYCEPDFLEKIVPLFQRQSVMLAFARSIFMQDGKKVWSTEEYLKDLHQLSWEEPFTMTAHNLVKAGFARKNVIPNVSSAVFRNVGKFTEEKNPIWESMKLCGDWVFYLNLIKGGCVSYTNETTNYYRVHQQSTSLNVQKTDVYYKEQFEVSKYIARNYKIESSIFEIVLEDLIEHYKAIQHVPNGDIVKNYYRLDEIKGEQKKRKPNILMCCYSMIMGGGETYPLFLANEMKKQDLSVSVLDFRMGSYDSRVRGLLAPNVPLIEIKSLDYFYKIVVQLGGEILHSHHASVDNAIADWKIGNPDLACKHIISLHGMYEAISSEDCKSTLEKVTRSCSEFIYTADKNLDSISKYGYKNKIKLQKMVNGLPIREIHMERREKFNIEEDAFVLCLVSRALPEKGWKEAVEAVERVNETIDRKVHLLLIGEGEMYTELQTIKSRFIHLLGGKSDIRNYFAMSDAGFLPSRYPGESYPLVVIDSLICGKPVIATDLGEIRNQLMTEDGEEAGILLHLTNWVLDVNEICNAIIRLSTDEDMYNELVERTKSAAKKFDIANVSRKYLDVYMNALKE